MWYHIWEGGERIFNDERVNLMFPCQNGRYQVEKKSYFGWVPTCKVNGYGASDRLTIEDLESAVRHVKGAGEGPYQW